MSVFRSKSEILLLEPCDGKLSRTVLRGESARKGADLPAHIETLKYMTSPTNQSIGTVGDEKAIGQS